MISQDAKVCRRSCQVKSLISAMAATLDFFSRFVVGWAPVP